MTRALRGLIVVATLSACLAGLSGVASARTSQCLFIAASAPESPEESEKQGHELLFKIVNFALLVAGLTFLLRKPLANFLAARSESIRKGLEEGRKALEASAAQLQAVEQKLAHLEEEIAAFKASAAIELEAERQRMKQAAAEEAERVLASARAQIEASVRAAKLDLKAYTAQQALELAAELIRQRLDEAGRKRLLNQFVAGLEAKGRKN